MNQAFIIDGVRTPIGKFGGSLSDIRADDLAAHVIAHVLKRQPAIDPEKIDDVVMGCANQAGEDNRNIARMALLLAGLPVTVPGETVNRLCASGLAASVHAMRAIRTGDAHLMIAGGVEHMTRAPYVISKPSKAYGTDSRMYDSSFGWRFINPRMEQMYGTEAMGETAENLVDLYDIGREDQDAFAYRSQMKAAEAQRNGRLNLEIAPVEIPQKKGGPIQVVQDEFVKPGTTPDILAGLKPAFRKNGTVTAGNASGLNDGAAALIIASEEFVSTHSLKPLARMVSMGVAGVEPRIMGIGPVKASEIALKKAGLRLEQMDIIEINEAFAAQVLACTRQMNLSDDDPRINPNGGAIALGHPLGMSGARILYSAALQLSLTHKRYALVTMCIGVGQGYAVVIERM
ncbi:MAG: 3-oxoadipyl-CoA thiolase [Thermaurantimonas sp.]